MSRSNPNANDGINNPAVLFLHWNKQDGVFQYYDKQKEETIQLATKIQFAVLDILHTSGGFSQENERSYYSNEVRNIQSDELRIKCKKKTVFTGLYEKAAKELAGDGYKYAQSVYIALFGKNETKLCNIKLDGSAVGAWISFQNSDGDYKKKPNPEIYKNLIRVVGKTDVKKKGTSKWVEPIFDFAEISEKQETEAIELDKQLQEYLKAYFKGGIAPANEDDDEDQDYDQQAVNAAAEAEEEPVDELPF